ncbi:MAG: hypothetical protein A2Y17_08000 [Clostridiales bacterium GWF2_38_85]|nr:MAG: hypothetical protein A2Y17_08000 [Clostridiales bacterium GWF2_38_85]HBL83379.1 hypothetical protein [Clostridiales bacterium]
MVKIVVLHLFQKIKLTFLFILIIIIVLLSSCKSNDFRIQMLDFCENHEKIKLSDISDFDWDIAYIDRQHYMSGEEIKEKFGIEGEFEQLPTDFSSRLAFCKDNKLVKEIILNDCYIEFDSSVEIITPDTIFLVEWLQKGESKEEKLILVLK